MEQQRRLMTALGRAGRTSLAIVAVALAASACNPFGSSGDDDSPEGGVQLKLSESDMQLLASENPTKVRIRVFSVQEDRRADQEGNDAVFDLADSGATYKVTKVKLGLKEFEVTILNGAAEAVGSGMARHLVKPGLQQMDPISIKLVPPDVRRRDVELDLWVQIEVPGEGAKTTYLDVRPIIADCAAACHTNVRPDGTEVFPKGGLNLKDFPFQSVIHPDWPQDDIVSNLIYWMQDPTDPMPPGGPRIPDDKIALVEKWRQDGLLKFPGADQSTDLAKAVKLSWKLKGSDEAGSMTIERSADPEHPFRATASAWVMNGAFELTFEIFGIDGSLTHTVMVPDYVLPQGDGPAKLEQVLTIPYEEPQIDVPVIVTR